MTLVMDENVQHNGNNPGCSPTRDLSFGTEGSTKTASNGRSDPKSDSCHNGPLPAPLPGHLLGCNKEQLKQTIIRQEALFKDQVHELHRLYWKQKELMDEVVKQNKLSTHTLKLETSGSNSALSHVSSQNTQEMFCSPNLPGSTGHSSVLNATSIQLPLCSVQGKGRLVCDVPAPTGGCSKLSEPKYRIVGKKTLDLRLPADEYIDSESGVSLEEDRASKVGPTQDRNIYHMSRTEFGSQNLSNGIIQISKKRQNLDAGSDDPTLRQKKKHEWQYSTHAGKSGIVFDSFAKVIPTGNLPVSSKSLSKEPKQVYDPLCFPPLVQGMASHGLLPSDNTSHSYPSFQLVSKADMTSSRIPPVALWEKPACDLGQSLIAGQPLHCFSSSAPSGQSSILLMGTPCLIGDKSDQLKSIKPASNLDRPSFFLSSLCNNELNNCNSNGLSVSNELMKYKGSEDSGTLKNLNLNITPVDCCEITASQNILSTDEEKKFQDLRRVLPWFKEPILKANPSEESKMPAQTESTLSQPCVSRAMHGFELKKIEENDLSKENILAFDINEKSQTSSDLDSSPASHSKASPNPSESQKIEDTVEKCAPDENSPNNNMHDLGEQVHSGECIVKNEVDKEHKNLPGEIDLNLCINDKESMPTDIDFHEPVSPENKECSPPRGESAESQPETPHLSAGKGGPNEENDHITKAAEALVSIAAFLANNGLQMTTCPPSFAGNPLCWFAEIVSSEMDHPNKEVTVDLSVKADVLEVVLPTGIDFFEAMTLMLTETRDLECCCCKSHSQIVEEGRSNSPTQPKKGPVNRGRRNADFQCDILPGLASLSRCEVTEDLQTIGGLMKAAVTTVDTGSLRSAGMSLSTRGRKRSCTLASNIPDLQLKQLPGNNSELGIEKRALVSWGKVSKRRGGQRIPARNIHIF